MKELRDWVSSFDWRVTLEVAERIVVIVAALAAFWPLWQWFAELDDRLLDRKQDQLKRSLSAAH